MKKILSAQGIKAYLPFLIVMVLLLGSASIQSLFSGDDVFHYQCYAVVFWYGNDPAYLPPQAHCQFLQASTQYHTYPVEYPPLMLVFFSLPLLAPVVSYPLMFALCMLIVALAINILLLRYGPSGAAGLFALYLLTGGAATAFSRFDLVPAAFTLLCLILADHKHWGLAYLALSLGVLTKLYPIMFFPLLFLAEQRDRLGVPLSSLIPFSKDWHRIRKSWCVLRRWRWKNSLVFVGLTTGITGGLASLNLKGATLNSLAYLYLRPFHVEAIGGSVLWLASLLGIPIRWVFTFGSLNAISPPADVLAQVMVLGLITGYGTVLILQWRGKVGLTQAVLATLLVVVATGKVFSPQYLIWIIPLLAYHGARGRNWFITWGLLSCLTFLIFPFFYAYGPIMLGPDATRLPGVPGFLPIIAARNGVFLLITVAYLFNFFNLRQVVNGLEPVNDKRGE